MISPEALRPHYARFLAAQPGASGPRARVLLTGHSHQAWPDVARAAQLEAYDDAAAHVDEKWGPAFAKADALRATIAARIGAEAPEIALAASTHELVARFLSRRRRGGCAGECACPSTEVKQKLMRGGREG